MLVKTLFFNIYFNNFHLFFLVFMICNSNELTFVCVRYMLENNLCIYNNVTFFFNNKARKCFSVHSQASK